MRVCFLVGSLLFACDDGAAGAVDGGVLDVGAVAVGRDVGVDLGPDAAPRPGRYSTELSPTMPANYYVAQAELYFDTLDTRADPELVPAYAELVARWEWPPWLYLTGWGAEQMITTTRAALEIDPSTVPVRDCRFFAVQPFARCYVEFEYDEGRCPIYEEFTFNDAGEMTFIEAWSDLPGYLPLAEGDRWGEGAFGRLSTRIPGLGRADGRVDLASPEMVAVAAIDPEVADFVERASDFWTAWAGALRDAGPNLYATGCGWSE